LARQPVDVSQRQSRHQEIRHVVEQGQPVEVTGHEVGVGQSPVGLLQHVGGAVYPDDVMSALDQLRANRPVPQAASTAVLTNLAVTNRWS